MQLQTIPYRGHHLLAQAVLDVTRPGDRVFEGGVSSGYFAAVLADAGLRVDGHELDPGPRPPRPGASASRSMWAT